MRRKSTRNTRKASPEKAPKETETPKTRRSRRHRRSPSKSSESEEEVITVTKRAPVEATPDTTTKSHTPSDEEAEEPVWKVTSTEDSPKGEIHKLKICLTRPSPDSPEKKPRRSKSNSQTEDETTSSEDKATRRSRSRRSPFVTDGLSSQEGDEDGEEKGKGKSKGKHKSKIEKSPHVSEPDLQANNEISENAQVTPQSPSIDKPVDNENDHKVDVADIQNVDESVQKNDEDKKQSVSKDSEDDEPLSVIQKNANETKDAEAVTAEIESDTKVVAEVVATPHEETVETETPVEQPNEQQPEKVEVEEPVVTENETVESVALQEEVVTETVHDEVTEKPPEAVSQQEVVEETVETVSKQEEQVLEKTPESQQEGVNHEAEQTEAVEKVTPTEEVEPVQQPTEDSVESKEVAPEQSTSATITPAEESHEDPIQRTPLRRKLKRNNNYLDKTESTDDTPPTKATRTNRKWELSDDSTLVKITLESIQTVFPSIEFPEEPDLDVEVERERRKSSDSAKKLERKVSVEYKSDFSERPAFEKQSSTTSNEDEDKSNIIAFNRKISIVDDTASKLRPPPSPAKNPASSILFITNLVRPFTVKQLKELLERTGKVKGDGFWTDRIKSKCYVQYESQEEAETTRNALHGVQWPIGNGKNLIIDYATEEDMEKAKNPPPPPALAAPVVETKTATKENLEPVENKPHVEEKNSKDVEKKRPEGPVREWDIGKKELRRDRSRSRERPRKHRRTPSPSDDFISRKQRKAEEAAPQKLMDDLFLKTKATPSIYWQPLSPEEISMKQQQRLIRMEEHKRRMEENSRMKGREMGRGAFRRRYD